MVAEADENRTNSWGQKKIHAQIDMYLGYQAGGLWYAEAKCWRNLWGWWIDDHPPDDSVKLDFFSLLKGVRVRSVLEYPDRALVEIDTAAGHWCTTVDPRWKKHHSKHVQYHLLLPDMELAAVAQSRPWSLLVTVPLLLRLLETTQKGYLSAGRCQQASMWTIEAMTLVRHENVDLWIANQRST